MGKATTIFLVLAIITTLIFAWWAVDRIVSAVDFNFGCEAYLKRAADANTVELAKENLIIAIEFAEENNLTEGIVSIFLKNPENDVGFWYENIKEAYNELCELPEDATSLEKTNMLMKLRESLTDEGESGVNVTIPEGISIYPNNVAYFWWGLISFIAACAFWILFGCAYYDWY